MSPDEFETVTPAEDVRSRPFRCLGCYRMVELTHEAGADAKRGAWRCPHCGQKYPFKQWPTIEAQ